MAETDRSADSAGAELAALMRRYQDGDAEAFEELYAEANGIVEGYLRRMAPAEAVPDLAQETFLHVIRARRTYRPDRPFLPWLFAIARHVVMGSRRRWARRWSKEVAMDAYPDGLAVDAPRDPVEKHRVERALETLPPEHRELAWLAWVEGLTSKEISNVTGATPGAIKVRLHRLAKRLRGVLEPRDAEGKAAT